MKIAKQILKEFWLPFIIALCWSFYSKGSDLSLKNIIAAFSPAFFLASWACSQFFRIQKQNKVDSNFNSIQKNMESFVDALEKKTKDIVDNLTGGDSFCYWHIANIDSSTNIGIETIVHQGKHTLFDVQARIVDNDKMKLIPKHLRASINAWRQCEYMRSFKSLISKHVVCGNVFDLGKSDAKSFNIFWIASNGSFEQLLRLQKVDDQWFWATKVSRHGATLYEHIQEGYPMNEDKTVDW